MHQGRKFQVQLQVQHRIAPLHGALAGTRMHAAHQHLPAPSWKPQTSMYLQAGKNALRALSATVRHAPARMRMLRAHGTNDKVAPQPIKQGVKALMPSHSAGKARTPEAHCT